MNFFIPASSYRQNVAMGIVTILISLLIGVSLVDAAEEQCPITNPLNKLKQRIENAAESCGACHFDDNYNGANLINAQSTPQYNCLTCHQKFDDYEYLHPVSAAGACLICHSPHGSDGGKFLQARQQQLCASCHTSIVPESATNLHGEIKEGMCTSCHSIHGSKYPKLLRANFNSAYFVNYNNEQYALCFQCHKIDLLLHPKTSYNTDFRDGRMNLHYVHVNQKVRGRNCKFCHDIHAGSGAKLIKQDVSFGSWDMPVNFRKTTTGGSCSPGCHKKESYDREKK